MSDFLKALVKLLYPMFGAVLRVKDKMVKTFRRSRDDK